MIKNKIIKIGVFLLVISSLFAQNKYDITPPITPYWAYHHWVWEDSINTQAAAERIVNEYLEHDIPVGGVIIDSPWSTAYTNFEWNKERYPNPKQMIDNFHSKGVNVVLWMTGMLNSTSADVPLQKDPNYDYAKKMGYVVNNGEETEWWKGHGIHIDYTNPKAVEWFNTQLDKVLDLGIDGLKVDIAEGWLGEMVNTSIGEMWNGEFHPYYYHETYKQMIKRNPSGIIFARPFSHQSLDVSASIEDLTVGFCGDFRGDWSGLSHQINNVYKSARLGYGGLGFEVGGYLSSKADKGEIVRAIQFASFCPALDNGGSNGAFSNHLPWWHGNDVYRIYRYFVVLHEELIPYIFSLGVEAHLTGEPIIRNTSFLNESHTLGNDIFVKAVTGDEESLEFMLPNGNDEWIDYWTNELYKSGTVVKGNYPLSKFPIFIRNGAIIPINIVDTTTGHGNKSSVGKQTILIYPKGKSEFLYHKPLDEGVQYTDVKISVDDKSGEIKITGAIADSYVFLVKSSDEHKCVENADYWNYNSKTNFLRIEKTGSIFTINYKK